MGKYSMRDVNRRVKELKADGLKVKKAKVDVVKLGDSYSTRVSVEYINAYGGRCGFGIHIGDIGTLAAAQKRKRDCKANLNRNGY